MAHVIELQLLSSDDGNEEVRELENKVASAMITVNSTRLRNNTISYNVYSKITHLGFTM